MFFLDYALKATMMLMSLNGSDCKIDVDQALELLDSHIMVVENKYENFDRERARSRVIRESSNGKISIERVENIIANLEQNHVFNCDNETIELPDILKTLPWLYQFMASRQDDGVSCGYWTLGNAKAIDVYLRTLNNRENVQGQYGRLNVGLVNNYSNKIVSQYLNDHQPWLLSPNELNNLAIRLFKLNVHRFSELVNFCTSSSDSEIISHRVCENKLHVIEPYASLLEQGISLPCFSNNHSLVKGSSRKMKELIHALKGDAASAVDTIFQELIQISRYSNIYTDENINDKKARIKIDWIYLDELMDALDLPKSAQKKIVCFLIDHQPLLSHDTFIQAIKPDKMGEIPQDLVDLLDYKHNNKLFILAILHWIIQEYKDNKKAIDLTQNGSRGTEIYYRALFNQFKAMIDNNENGAIHFACYVGDHWILISVINLADKHPVLVVFDSVNGSINFPSCAVANMEDACLAVKSFVDNLPEDEKPQQRVNINKIRCVLFFYDLFIRGNLDIISSPQEENNIEKDSLTDSQLMEELLRQSSGEGTDFECEGDQGAGHRKSNSSRGDDSDSSVESDEPDDIGPSNSGNNHNFGNGIQNNNSSTDQNIFEKESDTLSEKDQLSHAIALSISEQKGEKVNCENADDSDGEEPEDLNRLVVQQGVNFCNGKGKEKIRSRNPDMDENNDHNG